MRRLIFLVLLVVACGDDGQSSNPSSLELAVLSSRPDSVTAGDALVEVRFPPSVDGGAITIAVGDRDVTAAFGPAADGRRFGVVDGLVLGDNVIEATAPGEGPAELTVTNWPVQGPVISGPHQTPFVCRTAEAGLGPPLDANCSVETRYEHYYKKPDGMFALLASPSQVPADAVKVMSVAGGMIPFVVRVERGTINRAIYQITTLYDPTQPEWTAQAPQPQWNKKVVYSFKGGCGEGHHQGILNALDDLNLGVYPLGDAGVGAGFAIISSSLNTLGVSCNDVVAAESAMMVKERFVERYGVPLYTMGWGGSGGSMQQHLIAQNYPGILDGIVPFVSYPDTFTIFPEIMDCVLLVDYFANRSAGMFPDAAQRAAVAGYAIEGTCLNWNGLLGHLMDPSKCTDPTVPAGTRCTFADHNINLVGTDAGTGNARRIYDNEGIQYGLAALNAGLITKAQFVHLNQNIGGLNANGVWQAQRSAADPEALRAIYSGGRVFRGGLELGATPIIDLRYYTDTMGDIHDRVRSYSTRARLTAANGHANNHIMFNAEAAEYAKAALGGILVMDMWLAAFVADPNPDRAAAVLATKPAVTDLCLLAGQAQKPGTCDTELPVHSSPRMVAGAPIVNDTLKCKLAAVDPGDYTVTFTANELSALFPAGVCDYAQLGVEQVETTETWQSYGPRP